MNFIKNSADKSPIVDTVFAIVAKAKEAKAKYGSDKVIDATIGSLFSEDGSLVAFDSVFRSFEEISAMQKAGYASGFMGNADFRRLCADWTVKDVNLPHSVVATPGGTGAVSLGIGEFLEIGETVVIPDIAWTSYGIMANSKQLNAVKYNVFDENDSFNLNSIKECVTGLIGKQNRIVIVINDPCHNPTGYSMSRSEWDELIGFLNEVSKTTPCIILNDIAYIDYSNNLPHSRDYMKAFEGISENVMVVIAMSCSKTLTSYGMRCGAAVIAAQDENAVKGAEIVFEKSARAIWSNVNNGAMHNFVNIINNHHDEFMAEKAKYIDLIKQRSEIFRRESAEAGLPLYPYSEGFFITVKADNSIREKYHNALMENNIFTVQVDKGIRVAVCSLPISKAKGLAKKMKDILDTI